MEKSPRKGDKNLIPFDQRTEEEQREIRAKGGRASGAARRARKTLREELLALLAEGDTQKRISLAIIAKAENGSERAWELIRDTIGEKPTDNIALSGEVGTLTDADRELLKEASKTYAARG